MIDFRRERPSYVMRTGGDDGGQGSDRRSVLREMRGRQERRNAGRRRQETEEGGKDYEKEEERDRGEDVCMK